MYHNFTELPIWQHALAVSTGIFKLTVALPRTEDYGLTSQIRRAANSIGANIAEGFGRDSKNDKKNFYIYARSSAFETIHHLKYGFSIEYFPEKETLDLIDKLEKLIHELNKIIKTMGYWNK